MCWTLSTGSAWDSLIQSLILLGGTDCDPTCSLFSTQSHRSLDELKQHTKGHSVSVYTPCYSLYIEPWWLIHHSDDMLTVCYTFLIKFDFKRHSDFTAWCKLPKYGTHTPTRDAFLFLFDVWRARQTNYRWGEKPQWDKTAELSPVTKCLKSL